MKITYYTFGNNDTGSSRLRAFKIGKELTNRGHEIVFNPGKLRFDTDVVIFQKTYKPGLIAAYRNKGVKLVLDISDYIKFPTHYADAVTVGTTYLKERLYRFATIVPDVLDIPDSIKIHDLPIRNEKFKNTVWFGGENNVIQATNAIAACNALDIDVTVITIGRNRLSHKYRFKQLQWNITTIDTVLQQFDVALCPFILDSKIQTGRTRNFLLAKSCNRVIKAWALGLAVIGTPIPSYKEVGLRYKAHTVDEWIEMLTVLQDSDLRREDVRLGRITAEQFNLNNVADKWENLFKDLTKENCKLIFR